MGKPYEIRRIHGAEHKLCRGHTHEEPTWVSTSAFRLRTGGRLRSWCNACESSYRNGNPDLKFSGYVPFGKFLFAVLELERRLGRTEAARRVGVGKTTWHRWTHQRATRIQAAKAVALVSTLAEVRMRHEVRSFGDIRYGRKARGLSETPPASDRDYYVSGGDLETLAKRPNPESLSRIFTTNRRTYGGNGHASKKNATSSSRRSSQYSQGHEPSA